MHPRTVGVAAITIAGVLLGWLAGPVLPAAQAAIPWYGHALAMLAAAIGVPMLLASVGTSGDYKAMARLWSVAGASAILLVASGASAGLWSTVGNGAGLARIGSLPLLALAVGSGLFAGLGLVKLSIRKARVRHGT